MSTDLDALVAEATAIVLALVSGQDKLDCLARVYVLFHAESELLANVDRSECQELGEWTIRVWDRDSVPEHTGEPTALAVVIYLPELCRLSVALPWPTKAERSPE